MGHDALLLIHGALAAPALLTWHFPVSGLRQSRGRQVSCCLVSCEQMKTLVLMGVPLTHNPSPIAVFCKLFPPSSSSY
jgi:hypothetical protein